MEGKYVKVYLTFKWVGENGRELKKYIKLLTFLCMVIRKNRTKIQFGRIYMKTHHLYLYHITNTPTNSFVLSASYAVSNSHKRLLEGLTLCPIDEETGVQTV